MMPTEQRCPGCNQIFVGSDAIGDLCPTCKLSDKEESCPHCGYYCTGQSIFCTRGLINVS